MQNTEIRKIRCYKLMLCTYIERNRSGMIDSLIRWTNSCVFIRKIRSWARTGGCSFIWAPSFTLIPLKHRCTWLASSTRRAHDTLGKNEETDAMQIEHSERAQGHLMQRHTVEPSGRTRLCSSSEWKMAVYLIVENWNKQGTKFAWFLRSGGEGSRGLLGRFVGANVECLRWCK